MPTNTPLDWPAIYPRTPKPKAAAFKTSFGKARDGILDELKTLEAAGIVVSTNLLVKRDGMPYAGQPRPFDPGVAVYFTPRGGKPSVVACDAWNTVEDNMQAIRRTLEALRALDRWGTTQVRQAAYAGLALPPAYVAPAASAGSDAEEPWWEVLGVSRLATAESIREHSRQLLQALLKSEEHTPLEKEHLRDRIIDARGRALDARRQPQPAPSA